MLAGGASGWTLLGLGGTLWGGGALLCADCGERPPGAPCGARGWPVAGVCLVSGALWGLVVGSGRPLGRPMGLVAGLRLVFVWCLSGVCGLVVSSGRPLGRPVGLVADLRLVSVPAGRCMCAW